MNFRRVLALLGPTAVLTLAWASPAAAQSLWPRPLTSTSELDLEWVRPSFPNESGLTSTRGVWVVSGRTKVGARGRIVIAVPYLRASPGGGFGGGSTFGNPYFGYESTDTTGKSTFLVGVRIPMAGTGDTYSEQIALYGDYDRFEEAMPSTLTLHAEGQGVVWHDSEGADVRIRGGTTLFHSTQSGGSAAEANSFTFDYGVRFGRPVGPLDLGLAVTGRMLLSGSGGNIAQRSTHQATFELAGKGRIAPRLGVRIPIDEPLKSAYDRAITIGVRVQLE